MKEIMNKNWKDLSELNIFKFKLMKEMYRQGMIPDEEYKESLMKLLDIINRAIDVLQ